MKVTKMAILHVATFKYKNNVSNKIEALLFSPSKDKCT